MQCSTCGFTLPEGAAFCTNCGAKMYSQGNAGNQPAGPSQVEPTIAASSYYQAPPANPSPNQQAVPPTVYGAPYSTPQQYSNEAPPPPPPANVYGAPPPPNAYGTPYAQTPGSYVPPGQPPTPPTRRKGPGVGLIIGIIVLVLLVVGGGLLAIRAATGGSTNKLLYCNTNCYNSIVDSNNINNTCSDSHSRSNFTFRRTNRSCGSSYYHESTNCKRYR